MIDTNVLLRFLRADHPKHSAASRVLFERAAAGSCMLLVPEIVIAEAVWVLSSFYKAKRGAIAETLTVLIEHPGISCPGSPILRDALHRFSTTRVDFADCYLAALAKATGTSIASFDGDFDEFDDVPRLTPP